MSFDHPLILSVLWLAVGILVLIAPRLLNFAVAIYFIAIGVLGLLAYSGASP